MDTLIKPTVTITFPVIHSFPESKQNATLLKQSIKKAKELLIESYGENEVQPLFSRLDGLKDKVDFSTTSSGMGIYVSEASDLIIPFSFPVKENVVVSEDFATRELIYNESLSSPFAVLTLSEKVAKLWLSQGNELVEVRDENFPNKYEEAYEYAKTSVSHSHLRVLRGGADKSALEEQRHKTFFKAIDQKLESYITNRLLIVAAPQRDLAAYEDISINKDKIIGHINGNADKRTATELLEKAQTVLTAYNEKIVIDAILKLKEALGTGKAVSGLQDVWYSTATGQGLTLLVEKDYYMPAYVNGENLNISFTPLLGSNNKLLNDAVEKVIENVLSKGGNVIFTEGKLNDYGNIALLLRYA